MSLTTAAEAGIGAGVRYREIYYTNKKYKVASGNYCTPFAKRVGLGMGSSARKFESHFLVRADPVGGGSVATTTDTGPQPMNTSVHAQDVPISNQLQTDFTNSKENVEAVDVPMEVRPDEVAKQDHTNPLNPGGQKAVAHLKREATGTAANPPFKPDSNEAVKVAEAAAVSVQPPPPKKRKAKKLTTSGGYYRFHVI
jgi:hypothetical protein